MKGKSGGGLSRKCDWKGRGGGTWAKAESRGGGGAQMGEWEGGAGREGWGVAGEGKGMRLRTGTGAVVGWGYLRGGGWRAGVGAGGP